MVVVVAVVVAAAVAAVAVAASYQFLGCLAFASRDMLLLPLLLLLLLSLSLSVLFLAVHGVAATVYFVVGTEPNGSAAGVVAAAVDAVVDVPYHSHLKSANTPNTITNRLL